MARPEQAPRTDILWDRSHVSPEERAAISGGTGHTVWLTGLSGSGKSTLARATEKTLVSTGRLCYVLDGDNFRHGMSQDLGFTGTDRAENVRRLGHVARLLSDAGLVTFVAAISPSQTSRDAVRQLHRTADIRFSEVFVSTPIEVCEARDPKGLYKRARAGLIEHFTGVDATYEAPHRPELVIDTGTEALEASVERLVYLIDSPS